MLVKLAFRNVKRQIGNYLIYFITVSMTVALMYAVNSVIYSEQLQSRAESMENLRAGLTVISIFVSLIVAFVLGYATSFMLRFRKREFGTYLTLGMTRRNILTIFTTETMIMCAAAIVLGIIFGLFIYQGLMMVLSKLLEMEFTFASYSMQGLIFTVVLVCAVFILASLTSAIYLNSVSVYQLIHSDKKVEKSIKHPMLWMIITLIALAGIVGSCFLFWNDMKLTFSGESDGGGILLSMVILAVSIILFHIGAARGIVNLLLKNKRVCAAGTNTFTLRQLSGKLGTSSVMTGILSFLIAFAVIGSHVSMVQKVSERVSLDRSYPFDINAVFDTEEGEPEIELEQGKEIISRYIDIESITEFSIYTTDEQYVHSFTPMSGEGYEGVKDSFIRESDFNRLLALLGKEPVNLNGGFIIADSFGNVMGDFGNAELRLNGKIYHCTGTIREFPLFAYIYFIIVIPDEAAEGLREQMKCACIDTADGKYDAEGLREALTYPYETGNDVAYERCDYIIKEYGRIRSNSTSAIFVVGTLYVSLVFVFMAMAILALKTLSELSEDKRRYEILYRLGTGRSAQSKTLFRQIFSFFILPFALPMLLGIPTTLICGRIMKMTGFSEQTSEVYANSIGIAAILLTIYILYFTATYLIAKSEIVFKIPRD